MARRGVPIFISLLLLWGAFGAPSHAQENGRDAGVFRAVILPERFDVSPPLRSIKPILEIKNGSLEEDEEPEPDWVLPFGPQDRDPLVQGHVGTGDIPGPAQSFDAWSNMCGGCAPPDPVGAVGPNHYVAMANNDFGIFDKTGTPVFGPANNKTLWAGFGGPCETRNDGDPVVMYDRLADRFILTQFTAASPYFDCVAVSATSDPTGSYYRYAYPSTVFPDYPKYGVWNDGYYMATRETGAPESAGLYALEREQMLVGNPAAQMVYFQLTPSVTSRYNYGNGLLPAYMDGVWPPPAGSPEYFIGTTDNGGGLGAPSDAIVIWEFDVDWTTPANSTLTLAATVPTAAFDSIFPCGSGRQCIDQPATANKLDFLNRQRPLYRAAYRNLGTHEALVLVQNVEAAPSVAGMRWYELRGLNGTPTIFQQGTYAPGTTDTIHRWMGSIAMDKAGDIAIGYSASNTSTFPSIWYSGRLASDPVGTMPQGEGSIVNGIGSQTAGGNRWGDYTSLNPDPTDDCTFWYINEYYAATSGSTWRLRVGAFKFSQCTCGNVTLAPATLPNGTVGMTYSQALTASGGTAPYSYAVSSGTLPAGLTLSSGGVLAGTPTAQGTATITVSALDSTGCGTAKTYTLTINPAGTTSNVDIMTGSGPASANLTTIKGWNSDGTSNGITNFNAYGAGYGANVAMGAIRVTTGIADVLTGPGPGAVYGPQVKAFQKTGTAIAKVNFYAYGTLKYGVNPDALNVDGDGYEEILTGPGPGAVFGPHVRGWNFDGATLTQIAKINFFAFGTLKFGCISRGGALDGDAFDELLITPGPGAVFGSQVRGFNYDGAAVTAIGSLNFFASSLKYGAHAAAGDVDSDGFDEILTAGGPDPAANSQTRGWNYDGGPLAAISAINFNPFTAMYGATLDAADLDDDGFAELIAGTGYDPTNGGPRVRGYNYDGATIAGIAGLDFDAFAATQRYGVNVAIDEVGP